jgi:glycerol uptake facilitator-like aquaporin
MTKLEFGGEDVGAFAIVYIRGMSVLSKDLHGVSLQALAICNGLIIGFMVYAFKHHSGAHFNPAVTIVFMVSGHCHWVKVLVWMLALAIGSLLGRAI